MAFKMNGWSAFTKKTDKDKEYVPQTQRKDGGGKLKKDVKPDTPDRPLPEMKRDVESGQSKNQTQNPNDTKKKESDPKRDVKPGGKKEEDKRSTVKKVLRTVTDIANPGAAIVRKGKEYYDKNIKGTTKEVTIKDKDGNVIKTKKRQR